MAKRMKSKIQPAVQTLTFNTPAIPAYVPDPNDSSRPGTIGVGNFYIDISQCVSLVNRRFYRQGLNWAVARIKIIAETFKGSIRIEKLPNTWVMSNAWEKSFRAWQKMIKIATDGSGSEGMKGKFLDYKIHADLEHVTDTFASNLVPVDGNGTNYKLGQWQASTIEIPLTTSVPGSAADYFLHAVGNNSNDSKSLIVGYENSRALPYQTDPNVPADSDNQSENWMMTMFNDGSIQDSEVIEMLQTTGDQAPYPYEGDGTNTDTQYPGGANNAPTLELHDFETITGTTIGGMAMAKGGNFPCGLMKLRFGNTHPENVSVVIQVDLVPGNHRGYLAEPMTEM